MIRIPALMGLLGMIALGSCTAGRKAVSEQDQQRAKDHLDLCTAALGAADYRQALGECQHAEGLNPDDPDVQHALGLTYFAGFGRLTEARAHLERAVTLREKFSDAENALGSVLMAQGHYDLAIPYLERAKSNLLWGMPHLAEQNLGWALYKTGKTDEGINHLKSAINMKPELCGAYDYLGVIYSDQGKDAETIHWLERYFQVCDNDKLRKFLPPGQLPSNHYRLGMAYVKTGNRDGARAQLQACVERFAADAAAATCKKSLQLME